jgi:hypothetical protein
MYRRLLVTVILAIVFFQAQAKAGFISNVSLPLLPGDNTYSGSFKWGFVDELYFGGTINSISIEYTSVATSEQVSLLKFQSILQNYANGTVVETLAATPTVSLIAQGQTVSLPVQAFYTNIFSPIPNNSGFRLDIGDGEALNATAGAIEIGYTVLINISSPFEVSAPSNSNEPAVPEPSTWAMMLIGFAAIGFAGYRKSRRESFIRNCTCRRYAD